MYMVFFFFLKRSSRIGLSRRPSMEMGERDPDVLKRLLYIYNEKEAFLFRLCIALIRWFYTLLLS